MKITSANWKKQQAVLKVNADVNAGSLALIPQQAGTYELDMISLFPQHTFHGHTNGLRADLAQAIADLHPRFVRFPGGCVAHGNGIANIYDWKGSIGPLEAASLCATYGVITRHADWVISNISSSARIWEPNPFR